LIEDKILLVEYIHMIRAQRKVNNNAATRLITCYLWKR